MRGLTAASILILSAGTACAPQPLTAMGPTASATGATRQCFSSQSVSGFNQVGDRAVDLTVGANRVYRAELFGVCPEVRSAVDLGVRTRAGGTFVCDDLDLELVVPSDVPSRGPNICQVRSLRQLTPAEIEAERRAR